MPEQLSKSLQWDEHREVHSVIVIGAGLAGACAARALALQGRSVLVLDAAGAAAQGASALPVGLMAPRKGKKEGSASPQTEVSRAQTELPDWDDAGMACTRAWLEALSLEGCLQRGQDWQVCGSAERLSLLDAAPAWRWQPDACWVKPQRLVAACLQGAGIAQRWNAAVQQLQRQEQGWHITLTSGECLQAEAVVLAASVASQTLLPSLTDLPVAQSSALLQQLRQKKILNATAGQALYAPWEAAWQDDLPLQAEHGAHACNGHGHFVPAVPWAGQEHSGGQSDGAAFWLSGATYVHQANAAAADTAQGQQENLQRVVELLPAFAQRFETQVQRGQVRRFVGVRCTTPTRQPVVGHLGAGLWLLAGLGSRGLSHAPLAATWLAEQMERGG